MEHESINPSTGTKGWLLTLGAAGLVLASGWAVSALLLSLEQHAPRMPSATSETRPMQHPIGFAASMTACAGYGCEATQYVYAKERQ